MKKGGIIHAHMSCFKDNDELLCKKAFVDWNAVDVISDDGQTQTKKNNIKEKQEKDDDDAHAYEDFI